MLAKGETRIALHFARHPLRQEKQPFYYHQQIQGKVKVTSSKVTGPSSDALTTTFPQ
jgi:hypothetical protein